MAQGGGRVVLPKNKSIFMILIGSKAFKNVVLSGKTPPLRPGGGGLVLGERSAKSTIFLDVAP